MQNPVNRIPPKQVLQTVARSPMSPSTNVAAGGTASRYPRERVVIDQHILATIDQPLGCDAPDVAGASR